MNLMIVEDEARLRQSLAGGIPWEEHGIEVVALASNGAEALRLFEQKKPDLLLVDVQMPEMDGLALVRRLRERDALLQAVILSGHDNFAYAQQALEAGVTRYLLKPAGERDILAAVVDAAARLRRELDRRYNEELMRQKWNDHLPQLRAAFVERLLRGAVSPGEAERLAAEYGLNIRPGARYAVAVVDAEPADDAPSGAAGGGPEPVGARARFSAYLLAQSLLAGENGWLCLDGRGYVAIVFAAPPDASAQQALIDFQTLLGKLLTQAREGLGLVCSAGIGGSAGTLDELGRLYAEACRALQDRLVYGSGIAIPYREPPPERPAGAFAPPIDAEREKELEIALELGDAEAAGRAFDALWASGPAGMETADDIREAVLSVGSLLVRFIHKQGLAVQEVLQDRFDFHLLPQLPTSREKIRIRLAGCVADIAACQAQRRKSSRHQFVRTLLGIAREEIDQELTLHTVADRLYVNPSYLSRLFKQEMGRTFSEYVLELKMERAKAALSEGAKVYDAARMVGYRDVSYFTKVFRKYWGVTPGGLKP